MLTIGARTKAYYEGSGRKPGDQDPALVGCPTHVLIAFVTQVWGKEACANLRNLLIDTMRWLRTLADAAIVVSKCMTKEVCF
jgi:hypothetical protein